MNKTKIAGYMLGLSSLLMASQANAAMISLTPSVVNVDADETFLLTAQGADFTGGTFGGGVELSWDMNSVSLLSDVNAINTSLMSNGWITGNSNPSLSIVIGANSVSVDVLNFAGAPANFDLFTLDFQAASPPVSGPINITASNLSANTGGWEGRPVDYSNAQVNVNPVPVPAAAWLFGSGLIGLVGFARRKTQLA